MRRRSIIASTVLSAVLLITPPAIVSASTGDDGIGVQVEITPRPTPSAHVPPGPTPDADPDAGPIQLPPTGGELTWALLALGAGAIGAGIVINRARRHTLPRNPKTRPDDLPRPLPQ